MEDIIAWLIIIVVIWGVYLLPSIIAYSRWYRNTNTLFAFNLLLSWIPLVWIICLIYSFGKTKEEQDRDDKILNYIKNNK